MDDLKCEIVPRRQRQVLLKLFLQRILMVIGVENWNFYLNMIRCLILFNLITLPKVNLKILNQIILKREMDVGTVIEQHD